MSALDNFLESRKVDARATGEIRDGYKVYETVHDELYESALVELDALRAQLAEAREALKPFAETSVDENYGGGGLWWTDFASGTRFSAYTGNIMSRRQLNRDDIYKAAEVYNKLVISA